MIYDGTIDGERAWRDARKKQRKQATVTEFKVPGEIATALATGRTEFLDLLINRLDNDESIPDDDVEEFIRFAVELVRVRVEDGERMREIHRTLANLREKHKALQGQHNSLTEEFAALDKTLVEFETLVRRDH